jgi:hypothetical protein
MNSEEKLKNGLNAFVSGSSTNGEGFSAADSNDVKRVKKADGLIEKIGNKTIITEDNRQLLRG